MVSCCIGGLAVRRAAAWYHAAPLLTANPTLQQVCAFYYAITYIRDPPPLIPARGRGRGRGGGRAPPGGEESGRVSYVSYSVIEGTYLL
jgi:hypothetical protein